MEPDAEPEVVLEGTTANTSVTSNSEVTSPARLRWVLLGLAGLVAVVLGLSQWQRGEPVPPSSDEEAAADENDRLDDEDEPDEETGAADTGDLDGAGDPEGADETKGLDTADTAEPRQVSPGTGLVVGQETGLALIMTKNSTEQLMLLDLDTGTEYELGARGQVLGMLDDHIVIQGSDAVSAIPLDSPDEEGTQLASSIGGFVEVAVVNDDVVWVYRQENFSPGEEGEVSLQAYDLSGTLVDQQSLDASNNFFFGPPPIGDLVQETGGGIYRQADDGFERVSTGSLVAAGDDLALVRECDDRRNCGHFWYEMSDWTEPLDLPDPGLEGFGSWAALHANDRWLTEENWRTSQFRVIEVASSRVVHEQAMNEFNSAPGTYNPFSPDGRWLAMDDSGGILIVDLDTGDEFVYESDFTGAGATIQGVFVDRGQVGFLP